MSEALAAVDRPRPRTRHWISAACGLVAIAILALSWLLAPRPEADGEAFAGTDSTVTAALEEDGVQPWFQPVFTPGSGEIEAGLFAMQAAAGAGLFGYAVGRLHGRRLNSGASGRAEPAPRRRGDRG
ncbi:MAG: cobalt transport protein CbiN [Austwickia sp.]|nr:cobalt transport protein CbiN [Actinomycetota bacterium]MCB1253643.1 cobalt transport protein CbiN [Austwickia sp.]MCO5309126.1 cobalt transport protein CbiN [Austwickia sp.]